MKYCPVTNVNIKRFWLTVIVGFVFVWGYEYLVHGILMTDLYAQTPQLWRSDADMAAGLPVLWGVQFITVLLTAFIFTRHYQARGIGEGIRYGILIGVLLGALTAASYAWLPVSAKLGFVWFAVGLSKGVILGIIYAALYRQE